MRYFIESLTEIHHDCVTLLLILYNPPIRRDDLKLYAKSQNETESLIHTVRIFSNGIGMEFGLDKCATIKMKRGKLVEMDRVILAEGNEMSALEEDGEYKYLGILEVDDFKHEKMREIVKKEYSNRG